MIDYATVTLQLSLVITLLSLTALTLTIIGTSFIIWLIGKGVELAWSVVDKMLVIRKRAKVWL